MAYDEELAERVREVLDDVKGVAEIKMFGGLCFTVGGNMAVGVSHDDLLVRLSRRRRRGARRTRRATDGDRLSDVTRVPSVAPEATRTDKKLHAWIDRGVAFASSLPPKKPKPKKPKTPAR